MVYVVDIYRAMPLFIRLNPLSCNASKHRGHFWSRAKDGGHTIGSAISINDMLHANLMALGLSFIERELRATEGYIAGIANFDLFAPVTLTLAGPEGLHKYTNLTRRPPGRYPRCANMSGLSKVIVGQTYSQAEKLRVWSLPVT